MKAGSVLVTMAVRNT